MNVYDYSDQFIVTVIIGQTLPASLGVLKINSCIKSSVLSSFLCVQTTQCIPITAYMHANLSSDWGWIQDHTSHLPPPTGPTHLD